LAGLASVYNGILLIECLYLEDGSKLPTFTDIGDRAFGKFGRYLVKFANYSLILGASCILLILFANNMNGILKTYANTDLGRMAW
jgi:vesicular inhibitory amino acid transporter